MLHVSESVPLAQNDSVTPTWNVVEGWGGRETYFLRHHFIDPATGLKGSFVIDQFGGVFDEADGANYSQAYSVVGKPGATFSHVLIRKKNGKVLVDFNEGKITVPWGLRNDDSIMYQFVRK